MEYPRTGVRDNGLLKVFGFDHPDLERIERIPVNTTCAYCEEPIRQDEPGFSMLHVHDLGVKRIYEHRACFLRGILGSVAHLEKKCSCYVKGSTCTDPEGMTAREAAEAALAAWEQRRWW